MPKVVKSEVKINEAITAEKVESKIVTNLKVTNQEASAKSSDIPDGPIMKSIYLTELEDSPVPEDPEYYENIEVKDVQIKIDTSNSEKRKSKEVVEAIESISKSTVSATETKKISDLNTKQIISSKSSTKVNLEEVYDEANVALKSVAEVKDIIKPITETVIPIIKENSERKLSPDSKNNIISSETNIITKNATTNAEKDTVKPKIVNDNQISTEEVKTTDVKNKADTNKFDLNGEMVRVVMVNKEIKPAVESKANSPEDVGQKAEKSSNSKPLNKDNLTYSTIDFNEKTAAESRTVTHLQEMKNPKNDKEIHSFKAVKVSQVTVNNPVTPDNFSSLTETSVKISSKDDKNVNNTNDQSEVTYKEIRTSHHMLNREVKTTIQSTALPKSLNDDINPKQITDKETLLKFLETDKSQDVIKIDHTQNKDEYAKTISEVAKTESVKDLDDSISEGSDTLKRKKESKGKTIFNILSKSLSKSSISAKENNTIQSSIQDTKENNTSKSSIKANIEIPEVKSSTSANMDIPQKIPGEKIPESEQQLVMQKNVDKNKTLCQKENILIGEKDKTETSNVQPIKVIDQKNENQLETSSSLKHNDKSKVEEATPVNNSGKQNITNPINVSEIKPLENFVIKRNSTVSDIKQAINRNSLIMDDINIDINKVITVETNDKIKNVDKGKSLINEDKNNIKDPFPIVIDNIKKTQDIENRKSKDIDETIILSETKPNVSQVKKSRSSALIDKLFRSDKQDKHEEKRNSIVSDDGNNADNSTFNTENNAHTEKRNSTIERPKRDAEIISERLH